MAENALLLPTIWRTPEESEFDTEDEDALRVHLRERRAGLWLTYAEDEDVFLPGSAAADALGEALFVDKGVDFEVVQLAQQAHWPFSVSW